MIGTHVRNFEKTAKFAILNFPPENPASSWSFVGAASRDVTTRTSLVSRKTSGRLQRARFCLEFGGAFQFWDAVLHNSDHQIVTKWGKLHVRCIAAGCTNTHGPEVSLFLFPRDTGK